MNNQTGAVFLSDHYSCENGADAFFELSGFSREAHLMVPVRLRFKACQRESERDTIEFTRPIELALRSVDDSKVCLRSAQLIARLAELSPESCSAIDSIGDMNFKFEPIGRDIVYVGSDRCFPKRDITFSGILDCPGGRVPLRIYWTHDRTRLRRNVDKDNLFSSTMCLTSVPEGKDPGYLVDTINVRHPNPSVKYSLEAALDARSNALFRIDSGSGVVMTTQVLDREQMPTHYLRVLAVDNLGLPPVTGTTTLQVSPTHLNKIPYKVRY